MMMIYAGLIDSTEHPFYCKVTVQVYDIQT
jgi:hypothetical protein